MSAQYFSQTLRQILPSSVSALENSRIWDVDNLMFFFFVSEVIKFWASKNTAGSVWGGRKHFSMKFFQSILQDSGTFFAIFYSITDCILLLSINLFRVSYKYKKIRVKSRARCHFFRFPQFKFFSSLSKGDLIDFFFWDTGGSFSGVVVDSISMLLSDGDVFKTIFWPRAKQAVLEVIFT